MFRSILHAGVLAAAVALAGCATDASLSYTAPVNTFRTGPATVGMVTAVDQRKEAPNRLATIMGGFGNPLKILNTIRPVKDEVAAVFAQGLTARGFRRDDGQAPFRLELVVRKFDADMIMGSTARIDLDLNVVEARTGRTIYRDTVVDQRSDFAFFATGVFANIADLQKLAQTLLDATVDRMLDKPEFRAAIRSAPPLSS
jgi:uncharacterized lipoprotein YajG